MLNFDFSRWNYSDNASKILQFRLRNCKKTTNRHLQYPHINLVISNPPVRLFLSTNVESSRIFKNSTLENLQLKLKFKSI